MTGTRLDYLPLLDGLRAVAVALVVAYHLDAPWARGGFLGVDLFFVISGFLITTLLLREHDAAGRIDVRGFWGRRFRRLVPALIVMVAATIVLTRSYGIPEQWGSARGDAIAAIAYVANWRFIFADQSYFETLLGPSPLQHTWSLAVEEQWYLLWPVAVAVLVVVGTRSRRRSAPIVLIAALAVASAVAMAALYDPADPTRSYFGTDTRAQQLLIGAALAWFMAVRPAWRSPDTVRFGRPAVFVALAIFVAIAATTPDRAEWLYRGGFLAVSAVCAVVVWGVAGMAPTGAIGVLASTPLRWIGTRSYAIYLWHWPVIVFVGPPMGIDLARIPLAFVQVTVTALVAELSYRLVEQPVRRSHWRPSLVVGGWAAASVVLVTAVVVVLAPPASVTDAEIIVPQLPTTVATSPVRTQPADPAETSPRDTRPEATVAASPTTSPPAEPAASVERRTMLVLGDSTALKFVGSLSRLDERDWGIDAYATVGCGLSDGQPVDAGSTFAVPRPDMCVTWREEWAKWRILTQPDVAVVMVGAWEVLDHLVDGAYIRFPSPEWDQLVRSVAADAIAIAAADGTPVVVLTVPCMRQLEGSTVPAMARNDPARLAAYNEILRQLVDATPNAVLVDLGEFFCPGGEYLEAIDGEQVRYDGVHVTPEGASRLADWLEERLDELDLVH